MKRSLWIFGLIALIYWLLPIKGTLNINSQDAQNLPVYPKIEMTDANPNEPMQIIATDTTPWAHIRLEIDGVAYELDRFTTDSDRWTWYWSFPAPEIIEEIKIYRDCDTGCQEWATAHSADYTPEPTPVFTKNKLGVVFANPARNWHGKAGWTVEITYAMQPDEEFWQLDDLAYRVKQSSKKGVRTLLRVEYDENQTLPPEGDEEALETYLAYIRRIGKDARLQGVHAVIIGSNFNANWANQQSAENPASPQWVARIFNGSGVDVRRTDNVIEQFRPHNPATQLLVGPVNTWNSDQSGHIPYKIDVPWLSYFHSLVTELEMGGLAEKQQGNLNHLPDGFAVQTFGRVGHEALTNPANEPAVSLTYPDWGDAEAGFRIYEDWLEIINQSSMKDRPVYINATNTFDSLTNEKPYQNYVLGWLTNAVAVIDKEPQIQAMCWFIDSFEQEARWTEYSLRDQLENNRLAFEEFDYILASTKSDAKQE